MSFISMIAQKNFLTVMSEGRVTCDGKPTGEENYKKFIKVDPRFIVSFGGEREQIQDFLGRSRLLAPNDGNFKARAHDVQNILASPPYKTRKIFVGFGGVNKDGLIEYFCMGTGATKSVQQHMLPKGDDIKFAFFYLDEYGKMDLRTKLISLLRQTGHKTPPEVLRAQKLLNDSFANINPTMNRNTFPAIVFRESRIMI